MVDDAAYYSRKNARIQVYRRGKQDILTITRVEHGNPAVAMLHAVATQNKLRKIANSIHIAGAIRHTSLPGDALRRSVLPCFRALHAQGGPGDGPEKAPQPRR